MINIYQLILNYTTLIAFIFFTVDLCFQIRRITVNRSATDISPIGLFIRFLASIVLLLKYIDVQDSFLIGGQILGTIAITTYFLLTLYYRSAKKT